MLTFFMSTTGLESSQPGTVRAIISEPQAPSPPGSPGDSDAEVRSAGPVRVEHPIGSPAVTASGHAQKPRFRGGA